MFTVLKSADLRYFIDLDICASQQIAGRSQLVLLYNVRKGGIRLLFNQPGKMLRRIIECVRNAFQGDGLKIIGNIAHNRNNRIAFSDGELLGGNKLTAVHIDEISEKHLQQIFLQDTGPGHGCVMFIKKKRKQLFQPFITVQ